jgi:hypothetical protein
MVKFSKNSTPLQNSLTPSITLSEGLTMPCANCTVMGFDTNSVLIPSHSIACKIMNEFGILEFKKQPTISSFILQFNFNKLEALLLCAPILAMEPPWIINLPLAMHSFTQGGLG